jgi:hypothetical protein
LGEGQRFLRDLTRLALDGAACGNPGRLLEHAGQFRLVHTRDGIDLTGVTAADGRIPQPPLIGLALNCLCQNVSRSLV